MFGAQAMFAKGTNARHEHSAFEIGFLSEVGQRANVVQVEVRDQADVNFTEVQVVAKKTPGNGILTFVARVDAAVKQHRLPFVLKVDARTTHFHATAQGANFQRIFTVRADTCLVRRTLRGTLALHFDAKTGRSSGCDRNRQATVAVAVAVAVAIGGLFGVIHAR